MDVCDLKLQYQGDILNKVFAAEYIIKLNIKILSETLCKYLHRLITTTARNI